MTPEQIAKLIEMNERDIESLKLGYVTVNADGEPLLYDIVERQQQIIEFLVARESERSGDHR